MKALADYTSGMKKVDVLIMGAGAAGLMCAIEAGKRGRSVLVLDQANKPGKKILMSGGGRCNFTNLDVSSDHFISHNRHFCKSALKRYQPIDFIALVKKHHIPYHEKTLGQLFCDNKAKDIVNMLLQECADVGVVIQLNSQVKKIEQRADHTFIVDEYRCQSLVIATGGLSIPTMGSSPFGYQVAEQFGLKVWPTRAGLVPLTLQPAEKEKLAPLSGVAIDCIVSCPRQSFREAMLFTHRGLSGPAMLQISSYWQAGEDLRVNFLPNVDLDSHLRDAHPNILLKTVLSHYLPKRMVSVWLGDSLAEATGQSCSHKQRQQIVDALQNWSIKPGGTEGYRTAEVTLGGVDCDDVSSKTFMANRVTGLYFIGEVLDVTGWLGGYNFQWAWSSGFAAGQQV